MRDGALVLGERGTGAQWFPGSRGPRPPAPTAAAAHVTRLPASPSALHSVTAQTLSRRPGTSSQQAQHFTPLCSGSCWPPTPALCPPVLDPPLRTLPRGDPAPRRVLPRGWGQAVTQQSGQWPPGGVGSALSSCSSRRLPGLQGRDEDQPAFPALDGQALPSPRPPGAPARPRRALTHTRRHWGTSHTSPPGGCLGRNPFI